MFLKASQKRCQAIISGAGCEHGAKEKKNIMSKTIRGIRLCDPSMPGFPDRVQILNSDTGDMLVYDCPRYGSNPNPVGPANGPNAGKPWYEFEGQLAPGSYVWECWTSPKHGKCLLLNGGGPCATTRPNPAQGGQMFAASVEIHAGYRGVASGRPWRGSLACNVVDPADFPAFIGLFDLGEKGIYLLVDERSGVVA